MTSLQPDIDCAAQYLARAIDGLSDDPQVRAAIAMGAAHLYGQRQASLHRDRNDEPLFRNWANRGDAA